MFFDGKLRRRPAAQFRDYGQLLKLRVNALVIVTAYCGAFLHDGRFSWLSLSRVVFGVGAVAAGTAVLNQWMEPDVDARMRRTSQRPLVTGRINSHVALVLGLSLVAGGALYLAVSVSVLTAVLALLTCAIYVLVYTPAKKVGPWCTTVGAIPGAMPIVLGWCAGGGALNLRAAALFAIVYFWQFPHFHAIALLYREDYARAGVRMLAVVDESGIRIARQIALTALATALASTLLYVLGVTGRAYMVAALGLGVWFSLYAIRLFVTLSESGHAVAGASRKLLHVSISYLPLLLLTAVMNRLR